jgi:hypothetical protein
MVNNITPNHKVYVKGKGFIEVKDLSHKDTLMNEKGLEVKLHECIITEKITCPHEVINNKICFECKIPDEKMECSRGMSDGHCNCKRCLNME